MIRVLHCVSSMNRGGLETFIMNVYRNIDRSKVQFDFLVHTEKKCDFTDEIHSLGGKIYNIPARNRGILENRKALDGFFSSHRKYKILHQHSSSLSYVEPLKYAKKYKVPIRIIHSHSTKEGGSRFHNVLHRWNQLFISKYTTHYFACSDLAGEWMFGNGKNRNTVPFNVINNGIDTKKYVFNKQLRRKIRNDLGLEGKLVVGHVGRLSYPKNHDFLINVFKDTVKKLPNSVLLLVGDGELRESIEQKIQSLDLNENVILTGMRQDIPDLLQAMDIFVFPSIYEGLPVTLVEAQSTGLPCLVSDNITRQVKITKNVNYLNLNSPISKWVDSILDLSENHIRQDESNKIINAGFDIEVITKYLQEFYTNY